MFEGAGSVPRRGILCSAVLLTLLCLLAAQEARGGPATSSSKDATTVRLNPILINETVPDDVARERKGVKGHEESEDDVVMQKEISTLLTELRQIAETIEAVRKEHGKLAHGVSEISSAVKDMNERSEHINKKVRKMSKALNKNSHHHKLKNTLRNLQKDHKRILEAMFNSSFGHHHGNSSRLAHHHNRTGSNHGPNAPKHPKHCTNQSCPHLNDSSNHQHHRRDQPTPSSTTRNPETVSPAPYVSKLEGISVAPTEKDNSIPEPVIEPQGRAEAAKKTIPLPTDCTEVIQMGNMTSGVYRIHPKGLANPIKVWCDHTTQGGGWTMMVARIPQQIATSQVDFNRNWDDYKKGFGDPTGEHWIGNEALHAMTDSRRQELHLNITDWSGSTAWAEWKDFGVASEEKSYILTVGRYASGSTAGDALKWHNGMKFSTPDRDNDALMGGQCAVKNAGGWWYRGYRGCYQAHPTGKFQHDPKGVPKASGKPNFDLGPVLAWQNWRGENFFPKELFLMFRPVMP